MAYEELSEKHKTFVDEYIANKGNATGAYIKAGYSEKYANTNATKLLQNTTITSAIQERTEEAFNERSMTVAEALALSAEIARGTPQEVYSKQYDHLTRNVIRESTYTVTPDFEDRQRSIDHILKVNGAYIDRKEITSDVAVTFIDDITSDGSG